MIEVLQGFVAPGVEESLLSDAEDAFSIGREIGLFRDFVVVYAVHLLDEVPGVEIAVTVLGFLRDLDEVDVSTSRPHYDRIKSVL